MSPSGRAPGASLPFRAFPAWRAVQALRARSNMVAAARGMPRRYNGEENGARTLSNAKAPNSLPTQGRCGAVAQQRCPTRGIDPQRRLTKYLQIVGWHE